MAAVSVQCCWSHGQVVYKCNRNMDDQAGTHPVVNKHVRKQLEIPGPSLSASSCIKYFLSSQGRGRISSIRAPKDHINISILLTMISGIPLILGLGTRM